MKKKHIYAILCFLWMVVIFIFSHQPAQESQGLSNVVIEWIETFMHIDIIQQGGWLFDTISFLVRKCAHMSEYALLAMLLSAYFKACGTQHPWLNAWLVAVGYAASDELHQLFIKGRSGKIQDVGIDSLGAMLGLLVQQWYWWIRAHQKRHM